MKTLALGKRGKEERIETAKGKLSLKPDLCNCHQKKKNFSCPFGTLFHPSPLPTPIPKRQA